MTRPVLPCGCAVNAAGLHLTDCPDWVNVGSNLAQRQYAPRREATTADDMARSVAIDEVLAELVTIRDTPIVNELTGCLTGFGVEKITAALLRDNSIGARIIREQVKVFVAWLDDATRKSDDGTDACHELIYRALTVHGAANTWQDATGIIGALLDAHRNGVRL